MFKQWKEQRQLKKEQEKYAGLKPNEAARQLIKDRGTEGVTAKELSAILQIHHGWASSILSNHHKVEKFARLSEKRDGYKVYVLPSNVDGRETEKQGRN